MSPGISWGWGRNRATEAPGLEARGGCLCEPHGESGALGDQLGRSRLSRGSLPARSGARRRVGSPPLCSGLVCERKLMCDPKKNIPPTKAGKRSPEGGREVEREELRGPELAEEGERLQTGVTLWCEPCGGGGRADPGRGSQQRDRSEARARTYRRALAGRAGRPQSQPGPPNVLSPSPQEPLLSPLAGRLALPRKPPPGGPPCLFPSPGCGSPGAEMGGGAGVTFSGHPLNYDWG